MTNKHKGDGSTGSLTIRTIGGELLLAEPYSKGVLLTVEEQDKDGWVNEACAALLIDDLTRLRDWASSAIESLNAGTDKEKPQ